MRQDYEEEAGSWNNTQRPVLSKVLQTCQLSSLDYNRRRGEIPAVE